jgi:hypothetical protein
MGAEQSTDRSASLTPKEHSPPLGRLPRLVRPTTGTDIQLVQEMSPARRYLLLSKQQRPSCIRRICAREYTVLYAR